MLSSIGIEPRNDINRRSFEQSGNVGITAVLLDQTFYPGYGCRAAYQVVTFDAGNHQYRRATFAVFIGASAKLDQPDVASAYRPGNALYPHKLRVLLGEGHEMLT